MEKINGVLERSQYKPVHFLMQRPGITWRRHINILEEFKMSYVENTPGLHASSSVQPSLPDTSTASGTNLSSESDNDLLRSALKISLLNL